MIVLTKQCSPKGAAVKKSRNKPDIKPLVTPNNLPLLKEKNNEHIKMKSGIAGKKWIFDKIAVSKRAKHNKIKNDVKNERIIFFL